MFSSSSLLYSFMPLYIVDCIYIHVIPRLLLKVTKANKELYLSSLVVFPRKEHKQDRINLTFLSPPFSLHI